MKLDNFKLMKIPFVSKKKMASILGASPGLNKYSYSGIAYYLVDSENNCIVWERAILKEFEYRPTDEDMLVTSHYKNYYERFGLNRRNIFGWSEKNKIIKEANKSIIQKVNDYSLNYTTTILAIEGVITGSNPTGSDKIIKKSPILFDPRVKTEYIRFINAIKKVRCHNNTLEKIFKENLKTVKDIEKIFTKTIEFNEFISKSNKFRKWIKIYNSDFSEVENNESDIIEYLQALDNNSLKTSIDQSILMFEKKLIDQNKLETKLRSEFRASLLKEAMDNNYSEFTGDENISIFDAEAAHILGVKEIKKHDLNIKWIADPNNGLLLRPDTHRILDKRKIHLNENGLFESKVNEYKNINLSIIEKILNEERVNFIKLRNKYTIY